MDEMISPCWFADFCRRREGTKGAGCEQCRDTGLHYIADKLFINRSNIPKAYLTCSHFDLTPNPGIEYVLKYIENITENLANGVGFYAWSHTPGTGKTTMACIALRVSLFRLIITNPTDLDNRRVYYLNIPEFLDDLRMSYSDDTLEARATLSELMDRSLSPKVLLLDDLGAEKSTEWVMERLYSLLNFRSANGLVTLITSNLDPSELEYKLGPRIASRLRGRCRNIQFTGPDRRRLD
jgi:DNA replication protein DnaC